MDKIRWRHAEEWSFVKKTAKWSSRKTILAHWILYIHDRAKIAEALWENKTDVVGGLIDEYFEEAETESDVNRICSEYEEKIGGFHSDRESVKRTLTILLDYDKDLISFMTEKLKKWDKASPDQIGEKLAYSLRLLSYRNIQKYAHGEEKRKHNKKKLKEEMRRSEEILSDDVKFERKRKKVTVKRVWAALRDYRKNPYLKRKLKKELTEREFSIWNDGFKPDQLELPGDRWNERFHKNVVSRLSKPLGIEIKDARSAARKVYEKNKKLSKKIEFYPERLDVSFDLTPRTCERDSREFCEKICVFGKSGGKNFCNPDSNICPVAFVCLGVIDYCHGGEDCPIYQWKGKELCKGIQ